MKRNRRILSVVMIIALLVTNIVFVNSAMAQEMIEEKSEQQSIGQENGELESSTDNNEKETIDESVTEGESKIETDTTPDDIKETTKEEDISEEITTNNETEQDVEGFEVISDNLPDYVQMIIEKEEVEPFQEALDEYYKQWDNSSDEEMDDEDDYLEEEDYSDDEDDYLDEEEFDEVDEQEENNDDTYESYYVSNTVLAAYKITFINTNDGSEYEIPEGQSVDIKVNNRAYEKTRADGVMSLKEDASVELLEYQRVYSNLEEETYDEYEEDDEEVELEEYEEEDEDVEIEEYEEEDEDAEIEEYDEYEEDIVFQVNTGGRYAILSGATLAEASKGERETSSNNNPRFISPKTGENNWWIIGEVIAVVLLTVSTYNFREKKIAKVHKTN